MKHMIVGAGVVGTATGVWLHANRQDVIFCDIIPETLKRLQNKGFKVTPNLKKEKADIYWICTAEWDTEKVLKEIKEEIENPIVVIRSTMPPGSTKKLGEKYKIKHLAHVPEFLKQKTAISDMFDKDRIVVGTTDEQTKTTLKKVFESETIDIIFTDTATSELIKYASNCWLAMAISYWNEIKQLCDKLNINPQMVANAACLDRRISKYGTAMLGEPFAGFCFPKDTKALVKAFEEHKLDPILLKAVRKVNEKIKNKKTKQE